METSFHVRAAALGLCVVVGLLPSCTRDDSGAKKPRPDRPEVGLVTPPVGSTAGGDVVTIFTRNFSDNFLVSLPVVLFGGSPAVQVFLATPAEIQAVVPPGVAGPADVLVRSTGVPEEATCAGCFTYVIGPPPPDCTIATVCPKEGSLGGGETVTITGTDFEATPRVFFGAVESAVVSFVSAQEITVEAPSSGGPSTVDLRVENTAGGRCTFTAAYTYRTTGLAPDLWEPNDTLASCAGVNLPYTEAGLSIHETGNDDYFCFTLIAPTIVSVDLIPNVVSGNLDLELYEKSSGNLLDASTQPSGPETITVNLTAGDYGVRIFGVCGEFGIYSVSIN